MVGNARCPSKGLSEAVFELIDGLEMPLFEIVGPHIVFD